MIPRSEWASLRRSQPEVWRSFEKFAEHLDTMQRDLGISPGRAPQTPLTQQITVPPQCGFTVTGQDGYFVIAVTIPGSVPSGQAVYHEIASATTTNFDAAGGVTIYGPDPQVTLKIGDPNVSKYWRLRSRFDHSDYNQPVYAGSVGACGPQAIYSSVLRSSSLGQVDTAMTATGANPLTQSGTTTKINVAATTLKAGNISVSYNSGTVDPGSYGAWFIYTLDAKKAGGTVTYLATAANSDITAQDGVVYFGKITTAAGGGGTGTGGGSGPCPMGGVMLDLYAGGQVDARDVRVGMELLAPDGGKEVVQRVHVVPHVPCFKLTTANGAVLNGASSAHGQIVDGGTVVSVFDLVVGSNLWTKAGVSKLTAHEYLGQRTVYSIHLDRSRTYWADGFAAHNAIKA